MKNPTFTATPKPRKVQVTEFSMDKAEKENLIAWLSGHPQVSEVKNGGKYVDFTLTQPSGWEDRVRLRASAPLLVWDPLDGLLHYSREEFDLRYKSSK